MKKKNKKKSLMTSDSFIQEDNFKSSDVAISAEEYSKIFGANKNLYRVIINMQDGLKPVHRRFIYGLYEMNKGKKFTKMAKASSKALDYHPHGETSIQDVAGKMANPRINNIPLVEGQGNFGSYKSLETGAARYIQCRLSAFTLKCYFEDFDKSVADMKLAYTDDDYEPEYLPARYPVALFNTQLSGIGYGLASNVPPFNPKEVMEATIKLIKNQDEKVLLIPDSPTGADVVDDGQFKTINETGSGTFTLRANIEIDDVNNILTVTSIPLQVSIDDVIRNIVSMRGKKVFEEIKDIKDYSNESEVKTVLYLDKTANPNKVIEKLYKRGVGLKKTYPVGLIMIDDYSFIEYSIKSFLLDWIDYRRDIVRAIYNGKYVKLMEENNINESLILVTDGNNSDNTIKIAKKSEDKEDFAKRLMKEYEQINSQQAHTISYMRVHAFTKSANRDYKLRREELRKEIKEIEKILSHDKMIDEIIISQLEEGIKLFGEPRKSKVVKDEDVKVENSNHLIGISKDGYIKKLSDHYEQIGKVGQVSGQYIILKLNNRESILVFDSKGKVSKVPISTIPDMKFEDEGVLLERYFPVHGNIVASLIEPNKKEVKGIKKKDEDLFLVFLTKMGFVKKVHLKEFSKVLTSKTAINLQEEDELVAVEFAFDNTAKDMIIYTNLGNGIRRDINEFAINKPSAKGTKQVNLVDGEFCIGFDKILPSKDFLVYVTNTGKVKLTDMKYLPSAKRNSDVIPLINLDKTDNLIGIKAVHGDEILTVFLKNSEPEQINLVELSVSTRIAKADKMIKTPRGNEVISFSIK